MNGNEMLDLIGEVKGCYIVEAQTYREENPNKKRRFPKRLILIAAIVSVLLTGCAVAYSLHVADLKLKTVNVTIPGQSWHGIPITPDTEETRVLHSLQGTSDSPNNLALQEWLDFRESYDQDRSLMAANNRNEMGIPEKYYYNDCYTWDMVAKMDEILEKYQLELLTDQRLFQADEYQQFLDYLNIRGILREGAKADAEVASGYTYREGTFNASAYLTLSEGTWEHSVYVNYRYSLKAYLDLAAGVSIDGYEEWVYTTSDGTEVLLALNDEDAMILCDREDLFITVNISTMSWMESLENMGRSDLEQFAELFDFTLVPQPDENSLVETRPTIPETETVYEEQIRSFSAIVSEYLDFTYYPDKMMFAFADINTSGTEELVLRVISQDGSVSLHIYVENEPSPGMFSVAPIHYICEGNIVESVFKSDDLEQYEYYKPNEKGLKFCDVIAYSDISQQWMRDRDGPWGEDAVIISEEEARAIIDSYKHIELDWKPIAEFPLS